MKLGRQILTNDYRQEKTQRQTIKRYMDGKLKYLNSLKLIDWEETLQQTKLIQSCKAYDDDLNFIARCLIRKYIILKSKLHILNLNTNMLPKIELSKMISIVRIQQLLITREIVFIRPYQRYRVNIRSQC